MDTMTFVCIEAPRHTLGISSALGLQSTSISPDFTYAQNESLQRRMSVGLKRVLNLTRMTRIFPDLLLNDSPIEKENMTPICEYFTSFHDIDNIE